MEYKRINYQSIINPIEALEEYKNRLLEVYVNDYGEIYLGLIKNRIDNAYYLFETNPIETYEFMEENGLFSEYDKKKRLMIEYCDYLRLSKKIQNKSEKKVIDKLKFEFGYKGHDIESLLALDYESFSYDATYVLSSEGIFEEDEKENIINRQNKYLDDCKKLGVIPVTDSHIVSSIRSFKREIFYRKRMYLIEKSLWCKRIKKEISLKSNMIITNEDLYTLLYAKDDDHAVANTTMFVNNNKCLTACHFPLISDLVFDNLDEAFFHENRHVIETNGQVSGFCDGQFTLMNEIRTEKNAVADSKLLKENPLFSNLDMKEGFYNVYRGLFPYVGDFFDNNRELLNNIGLLTDIDRFKELFGKENLDDYETYIHLLFMNLLEDKDYEPSNNLKIEAKKLVLKLEDNKKRDC